MATHNPAILLRSLVAAVKMYVIYLCPREKDSGMSRLSVIVDVCMCGQEEGKKGAMGARQGD
jgi:hypothetical protein